MAKFVLAALCTFGGMLHAATVHRAPLKTLLIDNANVVTNVTGLGRAQVLESAQGGEWITGDGVVHRLQRRAVFNGMTAVENVSEIGEAMSWSFDWPESTGSCTLYFDPPSLWMLEIIRMEDVEENGEIIQNEVVTHYEGSASWGASSVTVREGFVSHTVALETITNSVDRLALASEIPADFAGGLTTNDVCNIVTNSSPGGFSEWTITLDVPQNDWLSDADREMFKAYVANSTVTWHEEIGGAGLYWYFRPGGPFTGSESVWFLPPTDVFDLTEEATDITFCIAAERENPGRGVDVRVTREKLPKGNALGLAMAKDVVSAEAVTNIVREVSAPITNEIDQLKKDSVLVYRLFSGSNIVMEVTNYNSRVNPPAMKLTRLNDKGIYEVMWTETNGLERTYNRAASNTAEKVAALEKKAAETYAPRGWSATTSGLGADAPKDTTWISTPTTVIAGGLEYSKVVTSSGQLWFLRSNGMVASVGGNSGGYFDISASDGTSVFSIEKTDSYMAPVDADGISVSGNTVTIRLSVVSADHPFLRYAPTLNAPVEWQKEEDGFSAPIAVSWSGSSGAWVATVTTTAKAGFFQFEFFQEGGTKIKSGGAMDVSTGGILCTDGIHKCRPVYNSNGTVTLEVF